MPKLPNPTTTNALISEAINEHAKQRDRYSRRLGTSQLGKECDREVWYGFRWVAKASFPAHMRRLFSTGHWLEDKMIEEMRLADLELYTEQPNGAPGEQITYTYAHGHGVSKFDGVVRGLPEAPEKWHVWEAKSMNKNRAAQFVKALSNARNKVWPGLIQKDARYWRKMWVQYIVEMRLSGLTRTLYSVVDKDSSKRHDVRFNEETRKADEFIKRGERLIATDKAPEKISTAPTSFKCKYCDYFDNCHGTKAPDVNCRTCSASTPLLDGTANWHCERHDILINHEWAPTGCPTHTYHPQHLANWATVLEADENSISYEVIATGNRFTNGPGEVSSEEIRSVVDKNIIGNVFAEELRTEFGATYSG